MIHINEKYVTTFTFPPGKNNSVNQYSRFGVLRQHKKCTPVGNKATVLGISQAHILLRWGKAKEDPYVNHKSLKGVS